jgi:hypothetical protein
MNDVAPDLSVVTQAFGCTSFAGEFRVDRSVCSTGFFHAGIDLSAADCCERPLFTSRDGVVQAVGGFAGSGGLGPNAVCIKSDEGPFLIFGHACAPTSTRGSGSAPASTSPTLAHSVFRQAATCISRSAPNLARFRPVAYSTQSRFSPTRRMT